MSAPDRDTLGALLRQRREQRGLTLEQVSGMTRIKRSYLQALEDERFEVIPGEVYLNGFLRTYAGVLELDAKALLEVYREQTGGERLQEEEVLASPLASVPVEAVPRRRPIGLVLAALVVLAAVAGVFWVKFPGPAGPTAAAPVPPAVEAPELTSAPPQISPQAQPDVPEQAATLPEAEPQRVVSGDPIPEEDTLPAGLRAETALAGPPGRDSTPQASMPQIKPGGAAIKVEALAPVSIDVSVDSQPLRTYELSASAVLSWKVRSQLRMTVSDPSSLKVWLDREVLELGNRSELYLHGAARSPNEDG